MAYLTKHTPLVCLSFPTTFSIIRSTPPKKSTRQVLDCKTDHILRIQVRASSWYNFFFLLSCPPLSENRNFKIQRRDGNDNVLKAIGLKRVRFFTKIQDQIKNPDHYNFSSTKETMYPFFYPFLHRYDYDVKMPNFVFYGKRKQATTQFYFAFWTWIWSLSWNSNSGGCVHLTK